MNMEDLGYFLYMESQDLDKDSKESEEKINLELNPFFDTEKATQEPK